MKPIILRVSIALSICFLTLLSTADAGRAQTASCPQLSSTYDSGIAVYVDYSMRNDGACNAGFGDNDRIISFGAYYRFGEGTVRMSASVAGLDFNWAPQPNLTCEALSGTYVHAPIGDPVTCTLDTVFEGHRYQASATFQIIDEGGGTYRVLRGPGTASITPNTPFSATLSGLAGTVGLAGDTVTLTFGNPVSGFSLSDLTLTNLFASNLQTSDNTTFTFDVAATGDGVGRISLAENTVEDAAGNLNSAAAEVTTASVASRPEVSFDRMEHVVSSRYEFFFTVTNPGGQGVYGQSPQATNFTMIGYDFQSNGSGATVEFSYVGLVTDGDVTFSFPDGFFRDLALDNTNAGTAPITAASFDFTPPDVSISGTPGFPGDPYTINITFTEPVTDFELADIAGSNAAISDFANLCGTGLCASYSAVVTADPGAAFTHSVQVPAAVATDAADNPNTASAVASPPPPDGTAPMVTITGVPDGFTGPQTATITFDWGEDVAGFEDADITVTGGTLGPIAGGRQVWTASLAVDGDQDVTVSVAAAAVTDITNTPSQAASITGAFASGAVAEEVIREFLGARGQALIAGQPGLAGLLGNDAPSGNIQVTRGQGIVQIQTGTEGPVWAALDSSWSDIDGFQTAYTLLTFGSHVYLADETLLGVMVQFDHAASNEGLAEIEGTGWLVGPYYVARHGGLVVDARVLWGRTENEIRPTGTYTDHFGTERMLAMLNLSGEIELERASLRPLLGWAYTEDRSEAYVDALSNPVAAQRVRLSELEAGLDWVMPLGTGAVDFTGGMSAIFTAEQGGNQDLEGGRGRIDLGLRRAGPGPLSFDLGVYADGLFQDQQERYGASVAVQLRF